MSIRKDDVKVSIICNTYNHERYIRQCLNGFLIQEADFEYEILIHDDASADGTAAIIKEYERDNPKIKGVYQNVNQLSNGFSIMTFQIQRAKGKYIAICEGDDYWTDPHKLDKQVALMESEPEYGMCYTQCKYYFQDRDEFSKRTIGGTFTSFRDIMLNYYIPTASVMVRKDLLERYYSETREERKKWIIGDYPKALWFALNSKIYASSECTTVYRVLANSASHFKTYDEYEAFFKSSYNVAAYFIGCSKFENTEKKDLMRKLDDNHRRRMLSYAIKYGNAETATHCYSSIEEKGVKDIIKGLIIRMPFAFRLYSKWMKG
jgi:glycosyltransferase involved in cell wall biosynthesis